MGKTNPGGTTVTLRIAAVLLAICLGACSSTRPDTVTKADPINTSFRKGMTMAEVTAIAGDPQSIDEKIFGQKSGSPWDGVIWKYKMGEDPRYEYVVRHLTNTLIFTKTTNPPTLVYWEVEQTPKPPKTKKK
jgi:hypothetical protein